MADGVGERAVLQKDSKILVTVEDVLPDIIVVSFHFQNKHFQGVLLDSKKKLLPCGIVAPSNEGPPLGTATLPLEDKLFSASQRYSYFQEKSIQNVDRLPLKRNIRPPARFKNTRMTIRLRPRQVLCSKCRGICNENSENVDISSKKKNLELNKEAAINISGNSARPDRKLRSSEDSTTGLLNPHSVKTQPQPKKKKLCRAASPSRPDSSKQEHVSKLKKGPNYWINGEPGDCPSPCDDKTDEDPLQLSFQEEQDAKQGNDGQKGNTEEINFGNENIFGCESDPLDLSIALPQRVLRKKRSVGSMEDLWDENVFEETGKTAEKKMLASKARTPVIKISFGSGTGAGTVLEIPAKPHDIPSESESEKTKRDASAKAAKKALKKAKKEARRKIMEGASPARSLGGTSPRYSNLSPRYFAACMSPRQTLGNASPAYEVFHKKHKHKVKHKKKHKDEKKLKDVSEGNEVVEGKEDCIRECLKQKLSISLKRLKSNAYMRCGSSSPSTSDASDEQCDAVPDFPGNPLMMRFSTQTITSCQTSDGRHMTVGDVVWGKIHGFPWWPGKVVSISVSRQEDGVCTSPQAHVAWYGSSTSSLLSCDQLNPFLETFQMRYNKKKRGPYKEAIKQATTEARRGEVGPTSQMFCSHTEVDVAS